MSDGFVAITAEQRDALYEEALDHLSGISDLWLAVTNEDLEAADRLGHEFTDELRLILHDLGWGYGHPGSQVELTLPSEDLHRIFTRFRRRVESPREPERQPEIDARRFRQRSRLVKEACEHVLGIVARTPPPT